MSALYLVNLKELECMVPAHFYLCGFGKGAYKRLQTDEPVPEKAILFELKDQDTWVVHNNCIVKLSDVLLPERQKKPAASPCYHTVKMDPTDPSKFTLQVTIRVAFVPVDDGHAGAPSANNIASKVTNGRMNRRTDGRMVETVLWSETLCTTLRMMVGCLGSVVVKPACMCA